MFLGWIRRIFSLMLAGILCIGWGSNGKQAHTVRDEENCKLCISVLSDCHIEGNNLPQLNLFGKILRDVKNNSFGNDVALFLGDNTMNGQEIESLLFYGAVAREKVADEVIAVCGNHDVGNGEGNYNKLFKRYQGYNEALLNQKFDKPYYVRVIKGYTFIVIGQEELGVYEMSIMEEQYDFIEQELEKATASGKPVFVCCHFPTYDIGEDSGDRMEELLSRYDNVFFISGHTHFPCCDGWTFSNDEGYNDIKLPRCTELYGPYDREVREYSGYGMQLEVYEDEVYARVRNFNIGEWNEELTYHFPLV